MIYLGGDDIRAQGLSKRRIQFYFQIQNTNSYFTFTAWGKKKIHAHMPINNF